MIPMPIAVNVIKRDGRVEAFIPEKVAISCVRAGLKPEVAQMIADKVSVKVYPNIPTTEIRKLVAKFIDEHDKAVAKKYLVHGERTWSRPTSERVFHRNKANIEKQDKLSGRPANRMRKLGRKSTS
jgi:transcriptional repressor NrdR